MATLLTLFTSAALAAAALVLMLSTHADIRALEDIHDALTRRTDRPAPGAPSPAGRR